MKATLVLLLLGASRLDAQDDFQPPERYGIIGAVAYGAVSLSLNSATYQSKGMLSSRFGFRIDPLWFTKVHGFRLTPHIAYAVTDFRGMSAGDAYAFSDINAGIELSYRVHRRLRPYIFGRRGSHSAEHVDAGQIWNYSGHGTGGGGGLEIPILAGGSGFDFGFRSESGHFGDAERLKVHRPIDVGFRARIWYLGWSGSLRGM